ncbi:MAG: hypothetical protein SGJ27_23465 [Candidatus Melainabacteria bacterium]|nr:hypothetical protein [Candidatus Melainabacteria bacterium]
MNVGRTHGSRRRSRSRGKRELGAALSEFAPALFFLLFFALFPVVDMIVCGYNYLSCVSLNDLQLREASKLPRSLAGAANGAVKLTIPQNWQSSIIGGLSGTTQLPETAVNYNVNKSGNVFVSVTTYCTINPFLTIPFFFGVPGIGAPFTVQIANKRVMENPANYLR